MKKTLFILTAMLTMGIGQSNAQGILDLLKNRTSTENSTTQSSAGQQGQNIQSSLSGIGDFIAGLLGKDEVSKNTLVGTWTYKQPAVIFESENMLTNVGSMAAGKAIEEKLQGYLDKIGFTAGKAKFTFNDGGSGTITYGQKNIPFQWSVEGCDLTINMGSGTLNKLTSSSSLGKYTSFKMNCKVNLTNIQISFNADKLLEFISKIVSVIGTSDNSAISTIAGLAKNVNGMYLGLTLEK